MGYVIFNSTFFETTVCNDMEPYIVNEDKKREILSYIEKHQSRRDSQQHKPLSLKKINKTTGQYILGKCMDLILSKKTIHNGKEDELESNIGNMHKYITYNPFAKHRPLHVSCAEKLNDYFFDPVTHQTLPLFLDVEQFLKSMILGSNLLFKSSNLKLCLAVMVDRFKIGYEWSAQDIIDACCGFVDTSRFTIGNIEACLNEYCEKHDGKTVPYILFEKTENGKYLLKLTELIMCYNAFLRGIHAVSPETKAPHPSSANQ